MAWYLIAMNACAADTHLTEPNNAPFRGAFAKVVFVPGLEFSSEITFDSPANTCPYRNTSDSACSDDILTMRPLYLP